MAVEIAVSSARVAAARVRQLAGVDRLRNGFVFLAVSDVNGMIYWLTPWKSKSP